MNFNSPYNPKETEGRIYKLWEKSGFFNPDNLPDKRKGKFVTPIAPPNITGELHMGHALELTMQDILVRMKRMQGFKTLWIPGIDHAGIAAQNVVEKQLAKEGTNRHKLGEKKFLERMWEWKEKYGGLILEQFKKLGLSVDWSRTRFTMDLDYQKAVKFAFDHYLKKNWIYSGERVVNWCPRCETYISDLEVNYVPEKTKLYFIKYGPFTVATVRPETKLADMALAVNPNDERYKKYIDKEIDIDSVDLDIPLKEEPQIKKYTLEVLGDEAIDPNFGTGVIKVTPAHDKTDYEIAERHNLFPIAPRVINDNPYVMNPNAGVRYMGLKVSEARKKIVEDLQKLNLIKKIEDYEHNVSRCDRCNSVIEPLLSEQWFLKMNGEKGLASLALQALKKGKIRLHPSRWRKPYEDWLKNIRDWNINRQLWWGHKIPTIKEKKLEGVLDTWFSSALWPFAVLGWPNKNSKDYKEYYPTQFITSDRSILFLWIVRMIFSGIELTDRIPFKDIYIHPTVQTKEGKRMSKSLGTGINPLGLMEKYGADALRFGLAYQRTELQDMRFYEDNLMMGKKFANKLWNTVRYVLSRVKDNWDKYSKDGTFSIKEVTGSKSFGGPLRTTAEEVTKNLEKYRFGEAAHVLYDYLWHTIADEYIEKSKIKSDEETKKNLVYYVVNTLKLLHPFMPFITEEIYQQLPINSKKKCLMVEKWPTG